MLLKRLLGVAGVAIASVGCSTTATVHGLSDLPTLPANATGIVIPLFLQVEGNNVSAEGGCSLILLRAGGVKTFLVDFPQGSDVFFAELPEGLYRFKGVNCGHQDWDLTFQKMPHFEVFAGKISVLSGFSLYITAAQNLNTQMSGREKNRTETLAVVGRVSTEVRDKLVSGYTGKPIVAAKLESPAQWTHWKVEPLPAKTEDRSWPTFHACYRGEGDVNALWLGQVNLNAVYDEGKLVSAEPETTWNTFSEQFLKCAKEALQDFHPRVQSRLQYKIYL